MEQKKIKAFSISKYTYYEILMDSQLQSAGAQQSRLIERYKKNNKSIKRQSLGMKVGFGIGLAILPIVPLIGYFQIFDAMNTISLKSETIFFLSNFVMGIYFLMALLYILMGGLFPTGSLMTGDSFKILQILPISGEDLKRIAVMTLFRSVDVPLILMTFGFPVVLLIITQNILAFILCLVVSILNSLFGFCILIILGRRISSVFSNESKNTKRANLIRIITILGYMILIFGTSLMINWGISLLNYFFDIFSVSEPPMLLNVILSLIPLPVMQGYFISLGIYTNNFSLELLISSIIGISLFALLVWGMYKRSIKSLHEVTMTEIKTKKKKSATLTKKEDIQVKIKNTTPLKSYLRKDIISASHDMQTFIFIFLPIFYPIIMLVAVQGYTDVNTDPLSAIIIWIIIMGIFVFTTLMLIMGLLNMEESGSSIIASLPIVPRDQARAKMLLMILIQLISFMIISIVLLILTRSILMFSLMMSSLPIAIMFLFFIFEMKVFLFGKLKYKYILEELNKEHKIAKWILIILSEFGIFITIIILGIILFFNFGFIGAIISSLLIGSIGLLILIFIFTRMFPRVDKMQDYMTGGYLRTHPIIGNFVLAISYIVFLTVFTPLLESIFLPIFYLLLDVSVAAAILLEFLIQFSLLTLLWFLIIPFGLKLPTKQKSFKTYLKNIRLSNIKPISRNILVGLVSFGIFSFIVFFGAILLGNYVFDPNILFGIPSLINLGWTIFIVMLIPGIWEEVGFRGVMLPMLLKKYSKNRAIFINGLVFGLAHLFNLVSIFLIKGFFWQLVFYQVIYASFMGFALAYVFIKTNSLLPCIILHYLIDGVGQLFLNVYFNNIFALSVFLIVFIGIIPSFLIIITVKFTVNDETQLMKLRTSILEEKAT